MHGPKALTLMWNDHVVLAFPRVRDRNGRRPGPTSETENQAAKAKTLAGKCDLRGEGKQRKPKLIESTGEWSPSMQT